MRSFADVCLYEQEIKTMHAEMQAAERRYHSVKTARHEKFFQMAKISAELQNIRDLLYECRCKLRNAANTSAEDNENLCQELNSLSIKERQVCQSYEQISKEFRMIIHDDMDVLPTWLELQEKFAKAQDRLKACRELEAQSFQATLSGEGRGNTT
jgi:hypothetical protein